MQWHKSVNCAADLQQHLLIRLRGREYKRVRRVYSTLESDCPRDVFALPVDRVMNFPLALASFDAAVDRLLALQFNHLQSLIQSAWSSI